jgi:putative ABC transport system ATP-binding protein
MANPFGITLSRAWTDWTAKQGLSETVAAALYLISEGRKADEIVGKLTPGDLKRFIEVLQQWPDHFPRGALAAVRDSKPTSSSSSSSSLAPLYAALVAERTEAAARAPAPALAPAPAPARAPRRDGEPVLRVEGLNHYYGEGEARNQVLFNNNIEVPAGQLVVMTGPSGAGKTTLLGLIGALRSVREGTIEVLGRDLSRLGAGDLVEVRRDIGFIFQMHNLFDALSAFENVKMAAQLGDAPKAELWRRGTGILQRLGLGHRIGYKPRFLSGGERQRVAIGRALVNRPRLVLADEPTAALDRESTMNVIRLLKQTAVEDGAAVMMVTHDHRIIDAADRLVHMVDGRIMSDVVLHDALRICEFLRPIELFKTLTPRQLTDVAEKMSKRHYDAGETIIRKGDLGTEFFLVSDGEVEVIRADQEVARLAAGNYFGEVALISGEPRNATVVARTPVDTFVLGKSEFEAALASSQSFRDQLYGIYFTRQ